MFDFSAKRFNDIYRDICSTLLVANEVNGTREIENVVFTVEDIESVFSTVRNPSLKYLCAELIWYMSGSRDMKWISRFASLWEKISDDGITNNSGYGYMIQHKYGFNQFNKAVELLKKDPTSRRAVINLNYANVKVIDTKDEICTIALQFLIRNGKLNCTAMMRSNDIWTGLPYDIIYFTILQKLMADELGVKYGTYTHHAVSMHMYNKDEGRIAACLHGRRVENFSIDHQKLAHNAKLLYTTVNKENIVQLCRSADILKGGKE